MSLFLYLFFIPNKRSVGITHTKYYRTIIWKNNVSFFSNLDFSKVTDMRNMFSYASSFNQDLSEWDLKGKNITEIFDGCPIKDEYKPKMK